MKFNKIKNPFFFVLILNIHIEWDKSKRYKRSWRDWQSQKVRYRMKIIIFLYLFLLICLPCIFLFFTEIRLTFWFILILKLSLYFIHFRILTMNTWCPLIILICCVCHFYLLKSHSKFVFFVIFPINPS